MIEAERFHVANLYLAKKLCAYRLYDLGHTIREIASMLGVSYEQIRTWLNG